MYIHFEGTNNKPEIKYIIMEDNNQEQLDAIQRLLKEGEVMRNARMFATGKGPHTGERWLSDSLKEYFVLKGLTDIENPVIMRARLAHAADFFQTVIESEQLNEQQMQRLSDTLNSIAKESGQARTARHL